MVMKYLCLLAFLALSGASSAFVPAPAAFADKPTTALFAEQNSLEQQIAETLQQERYQRAVECALVDGLCDVDEIESLSNDFQDVFEGQFVNEKLEKERRDEEMHGIHSELHRRANELKIGYNSGKKEYKQENKGDWEEYLKGNGYGSPGSHVF